MCTKSHYSCTPPNSSTIHSPAAYYRCHAFQTEAPIRHFCSTIAIYFPTTSSMFDANSKLCKVSFAPIPVAEIPSKAMNRRLSCGFRIIMTIKMLESSAHKMLLTLKMSNWCRCYGRRVRESVQLAFEVCS